ncbi:MAG: hypothetical protein KBD15_00735 [Candidatus Magasanikbacteria bacterium]|jgi:hypothetical protein|nr:hypothetical protein [Candidatus Magasanikbacteria bacterium]
MERLSMWFLFLFGFLTVGCGAQPVKIEYVPCQMCPAGVGLERAHKPVVEKDQCPPAAQSAFGTKQGALAGRLSEAIADRPVNRENGPTAWMPVSMAPTSHHEVLVMGLKEAKDCLKRQREKGRKVTQAVIEWCNRIARLTDDGKRVRPEAMTPPD